MNTIQAPDIVARRSKHIRWFYAALLLLASVMNYIDRQTLSVLAITIQRAFELTDTQYGYIVEWFLFTYMIMYVLSGRMVDRYGVRRTLGASLLVWSVVNVITGFVTGFYSLAGCRALLGAAEPASYTASLRAAGDWFSAKERALVVGIYSMGGTIGAAIAVPLTAVIAIRYGWRSVFFITGAAGVVISGIWFLVYRDSENCFAKSAEPVEQHMSWFAALRQRYLPELLVARMLTDSVWYFFLFWIPKYMQDTHSLNLRGIGTILWIIYIAADLGSFGGGFISSRLVANSYGTLNSRMCVMLPAAICMLALAFVPHIASKSSTIALISLLAFCHMAWMTNCTTLTLDLFPLEITGTLQGMIGTGSAAGGLLTTFIIGKTIQSYGYNPVFLGLTLLYPTAAMILLYRLPLRSKKGTFHEER